MKAETTVTLDGVVYRLAFPLGAFEELALTNPRMVENIEALRGADPDHNLAKRIAGIGLRWAGDKTVEEVYEAHGWGVFPAMALATLLCGFAEEADAPKKPKAARKTTAS